MMDGSLNAATTYELVGEAPADIVYATDAAADTGIAAAGTFPAGSHPPATYPFAVVRSHDTPASG